MLKKYSNILFQSIQNRFSIDEFHYTQNKINNSPATTIELRANPRLYFRIIEYDNTYHSFIVEWTEFGPNYPLSSLPRLSITEVELFLEPWFTTISEYYEEINGTDPWSRITDVGTLFEETFRGDQNEMFNQEEKDAVIAHLTLDKEHISTALDLREDQLVEVNKKLDYLIAAVERLNKFDWKNAAVGAITSTIVNMGIDRESGNYLIGILRTFFSIKGLAPGF